SVDTGRAEHRDIVWTYRFPLPESQKIAGLACFYNEKVDLYVDGSGNNAGAARSARNGTGGRGARAARTNAGLLHARHRGAPPGGDRGGGRLRLAHHPQDIAARQPHAILPTPTAAEPFREARPGARS